MGTERRIRVEALTRVEGEGRISLRMEPGAPVEARLEIFEPPRYFEALLVGRSFSEAPDITARICGICPVAYQMTACHAMEAALGVEPPPAVRALRRLLYCGEWIASHALHVAMLHLPDLLGCDDVFEAARSHRDLVERLLSLREVGNRLLAGLGGREVHPVNVKVGGFWRLPEPTELNAWRTELARGLELATSVAEICAELEFPDLEGDWRFAALVHPDEYPMNEGRACLEGGDPWPADEYEVHLKRRQVDYSTALRHEDPQGRCVLMGPLARFALNRDRLTPEAARLAARLGLGAACRSPGRSLLVRLVEIAVACEAGMAVCDTVPPGSPAAIAVTPGPGRAAWMTEAPRGVLWHDYRLDREGLIESARIVAPTAVNQGAIEQDVAGTAERFRDSAEDVLAGACQRAVRCHDPCISCSTHMLKVRIQRGGRT